MQKVAIFVDVQNVYYTTREIFRKNFDYNKFWAEATAGREVVHAFAYAIDRGDTKQREFQNILSSTSIKNKTDIKETIGDNRRQKKSICFANGLFNFCLKNLLLRSKGFE